MCDLIGFGWENHCGLHLFFYFGYRFFLTKMRDYGVLFDDKNDNTPLLVHILYGLADFFDVLLSSFHLLVCCFAFVIGGK
jgi:hypothetical protein